MGQIRITVCRAPDQRGQLYSERRLNAMVISLSSLSRLGAESRKMMQGCVQGLEGGLWHRSIGTLVTSAEPRAERSMNLSAFVKC